MKKIIVEGFFGADNLGDDFILLSELNILFKRNLDIHVLSYSKITEINQIYVNSNNIKFEVYRKNRIVNFIFKITKILSCKGYIYGGGGLFTYENTNQMKNLLYIAKLMKFFRKKMILFGVDINYITTNSKYSKLWNKLLNYVDLVYVRNKSSKLMLLEKTSNNHNKIIDGYDLTFSLDEELITRNNVLQNLPTDYMLWCIAMPWDINSLNNHKIKSRYDLLVDDIVYAINNYPGENHILYTFFEKNDEYICNDIKKRTRIPITIIKSNDLPLIDRRKIFNTAKIVIAMRYHAILFSIYYGKPFLSISYSPKMSNLIDELNLKNNNIEYGITDKEFFYKEFDLDKHSLVDKLNYVVNSDIEIYKKTSEYVKNKSANQDIILLDWIDNL